MNKLGKKIRPWSMLFVILLTGCSDKGIRETPDADLEALEIMEELATYEHTLHSLEAKVKVKATFPDQQRRFRMNLRLRKDSAIWGSVSPAFGIEVARFLLTTDSVKFINRMDDRYYVGGASSMVDRFGMELERDKIQDLLFGVPVLYDSTAEYFTQKDSTLIYCWPKRSQELAKILSLSMPKKDSSMNMNGERSKEVERYLKENPSSERFVATYWIDKDKQLLKRCEIMDLRRRNILDIRYKEYQMLEKDPLPKHLTVSVRSREKGTSRFDIQVDRPKTKKGLRYPFNIPSKYERIPE